MSGMRMVSSFTPAAAEPEGGRTEADRGGEAVSAFGDGKKLVDEISSAAEAAPDGGEGATGGLPFSRTGNSIRTVSRGLTVASGGLVAGGSGNWIRTVSFFSWSGSAISV